MKMKKRVVVQSPSDDTLTNLLGVAFTKGKSKQLDLPPRLTLAYRRRNLYESGTPRSKPMALSILISIASSSLRS